MKVLELFSGSKVLTNAARQMGMKAYSVDNDERLEPDLVEDVMNLSPANLPFKPDIIWASPPCESFSVASIGKHWNLDNTPKSRQAEEAMRLVDKMFQIINELEPKYWFIENPRGKLRKLPAMQGLKRHTVTYCQYGETRMKPTDIWTNCASWEPRPACKNGMPCHVSAPRGSTTGTQGYKNYYERSKLPKQLVEEILEACNGS